MNVMVTGAGGFLGRNLAAALVSRGERVWNFSRSDHQELKRMGVQTRCGDLGDPAAVSSALEGMEAVFHVASRVGIWGDFSDFHRTNVSGTKNVIAACRTHRIPRLVYTSTPSVVFERSDLCGADETTPYARRFLESYARTKVAAEKMVLEANGRELATVALRPHLIFGPDDPHLIPRLVEVARKGKLSIVGDGSNRVDVTFIQNAVDAHLQAMGKLANGSRVAGQAYFIGQERPVVLWEFINEILARHGLPPVTRKVPVAAAFVAGMFFESCFRLLRIRRDPPMTRFVALQFSRSHFFSHRKARDDFGYEPRIPIEQALDLTVRKPNAS